MFTFDDFAPQDLCQMKTFRAQAGEVVCALYVMKPKNKTKQNKKTTTKNNNKKPMEVWVVDGYMQ